MKAIWKSLSRYYLTDTVRSWFAADGYKLKDRLEKQGVPPGISDVAVGIVREWAVEQAGKV